MATPSTKPGATPTHLTSSPHPSSAPLRSFAHKSPSIRTPTSSGPGHVPQVSAPAHQYATPLAVTSAVDDAVNFSSPSALLALGGFTGISPSPAVHDSLVGPGMNENDIQNLGMQGLKLSGVGRDSDEEQKHRIREVVQCLRARVAGRGVSREGIERLSQLEGFESIWQDNDINIAGNFVDLEIEFYAGHDVVKNVSLRYATPEYTEGERREEATAVLKRNLVQPLEDVEHGKWRSLQGFHENLHWLAKLDKLSQEVNCFEALENLEENLKRIWAEEGKDGKYGGDYEHLCAGVIGRPSMHKGSRIGLGLEYWVEQAKVLDAKQQKNSPDAMAIDPPQDQTAKGVDEQLKIWTVMLECEEGYPSLRISKEWVGSEVFAPGQNSVSAASGGPTESVNWLDPHQTMRLSHGNHPDPMALDSSMLESSPPNRRFVAKLDPPLDLPILAASEIYRHLGMQLPQEFKMVTYDGLLVSDGLPLVSTPQPGRRKRRMSAQAFDSMGTPYTNQHSYTFQAFESVAGRTIRDLPFSHPRQLADILPVFRQYALLASLIRNIFNQPAKDTDDQQEPSKVTPTSSSDPAGQKSWGFPAQDGIITLSNDDPNEEKLKALLGDGFSRAFLVSSNASPFPGEDYLDDVKVDVTLRTQLGQAPALMLLITDPGNNADKSLREPVHVSICFEIGLNGRVSVVDTAELLNGGAEGGDGGDAAMQGTNAAGPALQDIHKKIARVLEISQDLRILVEWVLRWLRQRAGGG
ncbi:Mediator complex subunit Med1 [Penicillium canariense]|uniref:Mediator of RNA polymerase II transcription subunit 1 n=1 Tax=Penicillium canariense TaxID=189055 RepID=A0A9W9LPF1_9EURO|nr:Mediator complex subunit Med1 [Penicillium canariense]KAJ5168131.1 Mediator complex subunit Med1 [Penicillium canariense]